MHRRSKIRVVAKSTKVSGASSRIVPFPVPAVLPLKRTDLTDPELDALLLFQKEHLRVLLWYAQLAMEGMINKLLALPGAPTMPTLQRGPTGALYWEVSQHEGGA